MAKGNQIQSATAQTLIFAYFVKRKLAAARINVLRNRKRNAPGNTRQTA